MTILQVESLHKSFSGVRVLTGVSFSVEKGERLALIGPNGAGKSTLLNILGGQLHGSSGQIQFAGQSITTTPPNQRLHMGISRSFQTNSLFFQFSVLDNLMLAFYGAEKSNFSLLQPFEKRSDIAVKSRELLKTVDLWQKRDDIIGTLSYGDQRLIEFAFAMASHPKLILLDEPSAGLPTAEARRFADIIRDLSGQATLIFCAHDMDLVFDLADEIMVLYSGKILAKGLPEEIRSNPKVQEIYLGSEESI